MYFQRIRLNQHAHLGHQTQDPTPEVQTSSYCLLYRHNTGRQGQGVELHHLVKLSRRQ